MCTCTMRDRLTQDGDWEIPRSADSKSKVRKARGAGPARAQRPETMRANGVSLKTWEPGAATSQGRKLMSQLQQREQICPFSTFFFFYSGPQQIGIGLPTQCGWPSLLSWLNYTLTFSRNSLTVMLRNSVSPAIWASLSPVKSIPTGNLTGPIPPSLSPLP